MKIDEISFDVAKGIAAESRVDSHGAFCSLVLRDIGTLGWPYNQNIKFYLPAHLAGKVKRIADAINSIMEEEDDVADDQPLVETFTTLGEAAESVVSGLARTQGQKP